MQTLAETCLQPLLHETQVRGLRMQASTGHVQPGLLRLLLRFECTRKLLDSFISVLTVIALTLSKLRLQE